MGGRGGSGRSIAAPAAPVAAPAPAAPQAPVAALPLDQRIVDAFDTAERHWRDSAWVTLAGLREALSDVSRENLDAALKRLDRARVIELQRDVDQKNISAREKAASLLLGGSNVTMFRVIGRTR